MIFQRSLGAKNNRDPIPIVVYFTIQLQVIQADILHNLSQKYSQKDCVVIVLIYPPLWSLELYQQTNARLWRQGQTSETVVIQHIITKGTVDERIMKALEDKNETQTALMEAVKAELEV